MGLFLLALFRSQIEHCHAFALFVLFWDRWFSPQMDSAHLILRTVEVEFAVHLMSPGKRANRTSEVLLHISGKPTYRDLTTFLFSTEAAFLFGRVRCYCFQRNLKVAVRRH